MVLEHEYPDDERISKEINTLKSNGHEVTLACTTRKKRQLKETVNNTQVIRRPISNFLYKKLSVGVLKFPYYFNFWFRFIKEVVSNEKFDAIHIHDLPLAKIGHKISKLFNLKFVLDLHENWPVLLELSPHTKTLMGRLLSNKKQWIAYEQKYSELADGLIVVADGMKRRLVNKGIDINKTIVIPNTSDLNIFDKIANESPDKKYITLYYSGGINKHRGLEIVIKGLQIADIPDNFRFFIIGEGRNKDYLQGLVAELNLSNHVKFLGWKNRPELLTYLLQADIAIIPHLRNEHTDNTSPNKIFHYMAAKKPILSSDCIYLKDVIDRSNAGLTYKNDNPEDLAEKLNFLLRRRNQWEQFGTNGHNAIKHTFNWKQTSKPLLELYNKLS